jgi:hypothetical protein
MNEGSNKANGETEGGISKDDVYASEEEGSEYRGSVYEPVDYDSLEEAPSTEAHPNTDDDDDEGFRVTDLPKTPKLSHIIGPGAILLGAALGSGETMFWPTLIAQNGWWLYWAFWIGVITQFFITTEIQRWTIATGESIFQGLGRLNAIWPWFLLVGGFFHKAWPGWAATGSTIFAAWTGIVPQSQWWILGVISMVVIWLTYQLGPVLYNAVENIQLVLMVIAVVFAVALMFLVDSVGQLTNVPAGAVSFGTLPRNMAIATFLGGLAYAGGGGYTNLAQSLWAREKGYGMSTYQGRIQNPIRGSGDPEDLHRGFTFKPTPENIQRWKAWWNVTQKETFLTFALGILVITTITMTIAAEYASGIANSVGAVDMWLNIIIPQLGAISQWLLYALLVIALFSTQYASTEIFVRNSVDIVYGRYGRQAGWSLDRTFLGLLTIFVLWGIIIIGFQFQQPFILLVLGGVAAGLMLWPYTALTVILNTTRLPEHTQPSWLRMFAMWWGTGFFGYFSVLLIGDGIVSYLGVNAFAVSPSIVGSGIGGYALWLFALIVQAYTMYRSAQAKLNARDTVEGASEANTLLG